MAKTLTDLHEVVLLQLLENYLPLTDLIALGQVSRKLRQIVHEKVQWTKIYRRNLFVSFPMLKTNSACPQIKVRTLFRFFQLNSFIVDVVAVSHFCLKQNEQHFKSPNELIVSFSCRICRFHDPF